MGASFAPGTAVVKSGTARSSSPKAGGWLATATRARKGKPLGTYTSISGREISIDGTQTRWLSFSEMWTVYRRVPDVRACIDSIVRRVATWDWDVEPAVDAGDDQYESLLDEAETVRRFLAAPNKDGETWQEILTKFVTDLLVFDQGAIELVMDRKNEIAELVVLRGSTIIIDRDELGRTKEYLQAYATDDDTIGLSKEPIRFKPEELLFMRLFPNTASPYGNSLIEAIVDEVTTLLRASEHIMLAYDADEIPPGIVVLAGIQGEAANKAAQDLREMRGQDHKIRVLTTPDPTAAGAKWVELRHTPKDLALREIVNDIRRVVYRAYGVMPVEMGHTEDIPRASAEVQMEIGASHLVNPILELIEAKVNARIVPLLLKGKGKEGEELASKVVFRFNRDAKITAEDRKAMAERLALLVDKGIITRNEARAEEGLPPTDDRELGDTLTVEGNARPLDAVLTATGEMLGPDGKPIGPDGKPVEPDDDDPDDGGDGNPDSADDAPGENDGKDDEERSRQECMLALLPDLQASGLTLEDAVARAYDECVERQGAKGDGGRKGVHSERQHQHTGTCGCAGRWADTYALVMANELPATFALAMEREHAFRLARDLPSDWQPTGRFRKYRTLNLSALGDELSGYARDIKPVWRESRDEVVAAVARAYDVKRGGFTEEKATEARAALDAAIHRLEVKWRALSGPRYRAAAQIGRDAAVDFTGSAEAAEGWENRAELFFGRAMAYLTDEKGPLKSAKRAIEALISRGTKAQRSAGEDPTTRAAEEIELVMGEEGIVAESVLLKAVEAAFDAEEHRVYGWAGKLVELSNEEMVADVNRATGSDPDEEWWAEWVYVGDRATCQTCEELGMLGFQPLSAFKTQPGGDTECRGNCRCVLTLWKRSEVESGTATRLGPTG